MEHQATPSRPRRLAGLALAVALFGSIACSGTQPKQAGSDDDFGAKPAGGGESTPPSGGSEASTPPPSSGGDAPSGGGEGAGRLNKEQNEQIQIALRRGRDKAVQCPAVVPNAPTGEGSVKVTFDGKKGRSIDASVGPPFAGTPIEACIKRAFIDEIVVPFDGGPLDMSTTVKLAAKPPAPDAAKPKK